MTVKQSCTLFHAGKLKHVVSPPLLQFTRYFVGPLAITLFENNLRYWIILTVMKLLFKVYC